MISPSEMSVKSFLRSKYGPQIVNRISRYERCREKVARYKNHVIFNLRCKQKGLIPKGLTLRSPIDTDQGHRIVRNASRQLLNERLRLVNCTIRQLEDERKWRELGLRRLVDQDDFEKIVKMTKETEEFEFTRVKERQRRKLQNLLEPRNESRDARAHHEDAASRFDDRSVSKKNWIINLSSLKLSKEQTSVLEHGFNFARAPNKVPKEEIIAGVEAALRKQPRLPPERAERARAAVANVLRKAKPPTPNMTKAEREAMTQLQRNKEITILCADKGNITVLLDTPDYELKAHDLLSKPPFRKLKKDPTTRNETRINDCLKRLAKADKDNEGIFQCLQVSSNGTAPAMFYGSVKLHKEGYPLRPIVSTVGTATYNIASYINSVLAPYVQSVPSYIRNTADFVERIGSVRIEEDEIMVSFDIKSLFTSVPVDQATEAITMILQNDDSFHERCRIKIASFMELLRLCTSITTFQFRGQHYELADGLPMGSPASPCIANLFIARLESNALDSFPTSTKLWLRYVDDVFSIVKRAVVDQLLSHLNAQHPSIVFTLEIESDGKLPFMDVLVHRCDDQLKTSVYRKPTHTGRYLNYSSHHPETNKRSVVSALLSRMKYVTLDDDSRGKEEQRVYDDLLRNDYPRSFVRRVHRKMKKAMPKDDAEQGNEQPPVKSPESTCCIPYVQGVSEAVSRILRPLDIRTVGRANKVKWSLMKGAKDVLPREQQPGAIYALGCQGCPGVYIGETKRTAKQRTKEHRMHTRLGHPKLSAVASHVHETGHMMHWIPRVLGCERHLVKRKVKEALLIGKLMNRKGQEATLNQDTGMEVSKLWLDLVCPHQ